MEERDLITLSIKELIQMLEEITFNQNGDVLTGNRVEKKLEARVEAENVADAKEKETEAEEKVEDEIAEVKETEKEPTELKLSSFPREEKLGEVSGNNRREKTKAEAFSVIEVESNISIDVQHTNVVARESNIEVKRGEHLKEKKKPGTFKVLQAINIASSIPKFEVQQIDVMGIETTLKMRPTYYTEKTRVKSWRYDKRRRKRERLKAVLEWLNIMTLKVAFSAKKRKRTLKEEKGFRVNKIQYFTIGPKSYSAHSYSPTVARMTWNTRETVSAILNTENLRKTETTITDAKTDCNLESERVCCLLEATENIAKGLWKNGMNM